VSETLRVGHEQRAWIERQERDFEDHVSHWHARVARSVGAPRPGPDLLDPAERVQPVDVLAAEGDQVIEVVLAAPDAEAARQAAGRLIERTEMRFALTLDPQGALTSGRDGPERLRSLHPGLRIGQPAPGDHRRLAVPADAEPARGWLERIRGGRPLLEVGRPPAWLPADAASLVLDDAALMMPTGAPPAGGWPDRADSALPNLRIAYLLSGLPEGGSGGTHSIVQEARALRALGSDARVLIPDTALDRARRAYPGDDGFIAYADADALASAVADRDVLVATEHTSVDAVLDAGAGRADLVRAYYVQDYEPLFAPPGGATSDHALLSYTSAADLCLYAKTDWLANAVASCHGVAVAKVEPSLDHGRFRPAVRDHGGPLRIVAMTRPNTPRRRPLATLRALERAVAELGADATTFGCSTEELHTLAGDTSVRNVGRLRGEEVAALLAGADVLLDLSSYQAFGRTALEAMACGCVPVAPRLGGTAEIAGGEDACLVDTLDPDAVQAALAALDADRPQLVRRAKAGVARAARSSVERAALSQLALFTAAADRRRR
jgi:hypothetical protein